jgi:hypothetical protein
MVFGQVILTESFNTLKAGSLGTDITWATVGQNGWFTLYGYNGDDRIVTVSSARENIWQNPGSDLPREL